VTNFSTSFDQKTVRRYVGGKLAGNRPEHSTSSIFKLEREITMRTRFVSICLALLLICLLMSSAQARNLADSSPTPTPIPDATHPEDPVALTASDANAPKSAEATYRYFSLSGSVFIPSSNTIAWNYGGGGCIHPTVGGQWRGTLNLLEGSKIHSLWMGYYNYSTSAATTLSLVRYDQRGPITTIATVTSASGSGGNTGYKQVSVLLASDHVVDNSWYSYAFVWNGPASTTTVQELCSAQVG
jgi:hypothetical protein